MNKKCLKIVLCSFIFAISFCLFENNAEAKFTYKFSENIISVNSADTTSPFINERNYNVDYDNFVEDVKIDYYDDLKIKSAKYWFNETNKSFSGDGTDFASGTIFSNSGWYRIVVEDLYSQQTEYIFILDKEFNDLKISSTVANDSGATLSISAKDKLSGIKKIEVYIGDNLYNSYTYSEIFGTNEVNENLTVAIDKLLFYENVYLKAEDYYGNTLSSNVVVPNTTRICNLKDLLKFRSMVNSGTTFSGVSLYLLNNIDISNACSSLVGSWEAIGVNYSFAGTFFGNNHTISNLYINNSNNTKGLFGNNSGKIYKLTVEGNITGSGQYIGGIVGYNKGTVDYCDSSVTISGTGSYVGGIARK
jgi:hypothetical protein